MIENLQLYEKDGLLKGEKTKDGIMDYPEVEVRRTAHLGNGSWLLLILFRLSDIIKLIFFVRMYMDLNKYQEAKMEHLSIIQTAEK